LARGRREDQPQKIILGSQNFGLQKSENIASLRFSKLKQVIVLSDFFRWYFFARKLKKAKSLKNRNFWISVKKVPSKKI
tara:strand:+ start:124 stop:360 length:237 start_codon:yes stop_codon:yes gene_type:complete